MGKRMFDAGEQAWPEEAPFHTPVFVVTHAERDPWERPGGTTFHSRQRRHRVHARPGPRSRGRPGRPHRRRRPTILEYLNADLIDEFSIALSPVLLS